MVIEQRIFSFVLVPHLVHAAEVSGPQSRRTNSRCFPAVSRRLQFLSKSAGREKGRTVLSADSNVLFFVSLPVNAGCERTESRM
jgi:hypothetical protein